MHHPLVRKRPGMPRSGQGGTIPSKSRLAHLLREAKPVDGAGGRKRRAGAFPGGRGECFLKGRQQGQRLCGD